MNKKEMLVAAIQNGTVIDHIPSEKAYQVAQLLKLAQLDTPVTIGYNFRSKKLGRKGIIKVEDKFFTDDEISRQIALELTPEGMTMPLEIVFQSLDNLHKAIPNHSGDWYFSGDYPTPGGNRVVNDTFINYIEGNANKRIMY